MKENETKSHVMLSSQDSVYVNIVIVQIENSKCPNLLGINIDSKLAFEDHIKRSVRSLAQN